MKKTVIALSLLAAIGVTGCSTTKDAGVRAPVESTTAIKDTRITTEFADEGVKLHYTFTGKLEKQSDTDGGVSFPRDRYVAFFISVS